MRGAHAGGGGGGTTEILADARIGCGRVSNLRVLPGQVVRPSVGDSWFVF